MLNNDLTVVKFVGGPNRPSSGTLLLLVGALVRRKRTAEMTKQDIRGMGERRKVRSGI